MVLSLPVVTARADSTADLCAILGPAGQYMVAATHQIEVREYYPGPRYVPYPSVGDRICAPNIKAGKAAHFKNDLVATAAEGTAISFGIVTHRPHSDFGLCGYYNGYPCNANYVYYGDVVTGGGAVTSRPAIPPKLSPGYVIDTTGSHPQVAECEAAITQLFAASDALAQGLLPGEPPSAARLIIDLGDIHVTRDEMVILSPFPGEPITIYQARDVTIAGGKREPGYINYITEGGRLSMNGTYDQMVVLNITHRLRMGRKAFIDSGRSLVNLVGTGPGVVIERGRAEGILLAPRRNIRMRALGGGGETYYTEAGQLFGRKVKITGSSGLNHYYGMDPQYCGFSPD